jgi:phospholipid transport system substrate-binding protein
MKIKFLLISLILCVLAGFNIQAATKSAEQVVRDAVEQATQKLIAEKAQLQVHPEHIYDLIQDLVVPYFDFPIISRLVLGKETWSQASEAQKEAFMREFKTLLIRTYAKALQEYSDEEITIYPSAMNPGSNLVEIKTEVTGKGSATKTPINYRMHISGEEWKVLDLVVDGISLVNSYKGEYGSIVRKDGLDVLIARMKERNTAATTAVE